MRYRWWDVSRLSALLCCIIGVLAACATTPPGVDLAETPWPARQAALRALQRWELSGRIAVVNEQDGWHASLRWQQLGPDYAIELFGPFGQGRLDIHGNRQGVRVLTADGQSLSASDPEQLLEQTTGMRIPLTGLIYWLRGLPNPAQESELTGDPEGRLTRLQQGGWMIEYPLYRRVGALELPVRIQAQRDQLKVKLVVEQWHLQT